MRRKIEFVPGHYYHIYNHGVEERKVFADNFDFKRALVSLATFNDEENAPSNISRFVRDSSKLFERYNLDKREKLVDIIAFSLLPTHYHLFLRENKDKGISNFMHRFGKGYARYFNLKNDRSGALWQGPFNAKRIDNESYFVHIISYIHLNPLDLYFPKWREGEIKNWSQAASKLGSYPWSSYAYYRETGSELTFTNLILTEPDWLKERYSKAEDFESDLKTWSTNNIS